MTTYSFQEIGDTIYSKMNEILNDEQKIGAVFNHDIKIESGISLPAIIITPSNGKVNLLDSCSYENQINYTVRLIDRTQSDYADIEDNMRVVADMVMTRLKEIGTITWTNSNGTTVKCEFDYQWGFTDTQEPLRIFQVECKFTAVEN